MELKSTQDNICSQNFTLLLVNCTNETIDKQSLNNFLYQFNDSYQPLHGYFCLMVCSFGLVLNSLNIVVLTQKNMISPFNQILTALAIADLVTMVSYIPYALQFYCLSSPSQTSQNSAWIVYLLFNINFVITTHTIGMWLTVLLAIFRYLVICHPSIGSIYCSLKASSFSIIAVYFVTPLMCCPHYIMYTLDSSNNSTWFTKRGFVTEQYINLTFYIYSLFFKLFPCILLTILSLLIILTIKSAEKKRQRLLAHKYNRVKSKKKKENNNISHAPKLCIQDLNSSFNGHIQTTQITHPPQPNEFQKVETFQNKNKNERAQESLRTTIMLVAVVLCFVLAEFPQGLIVACSIFDSSIFQTVYRPLGDVLDLLGLVNSTINFILYCSMSKRFRDTFIRVFKCPFSNKRKMNLNLISIH